MLNLIQHLTILIMIKKAETLKQVQGDEKRKYE